MTFQPGQSGNPGGRSREKLWRDAIHRAIKRNSEGDLQAIDRAADALVLAAIYKDIGALKELGDRIDGKVPQAQIHMGDEDGGPVRVNKIEYSIVDPRHDASNSSSKGVSSVSETEPV